MGPKVTRPEKEILAVDCETDPFKHGRVPKPFLWGVYGEFGYWQTEDTDELAEFLKRRDAIAYAHNGGKFDWHFILNHLDKMKPITVINGRIAKASLGLCEIRDSINLFPIALEEFQKTKIDYDKFEADVRRDHWPEIEHYQKDDCFQLYRLVTSFIENYGMQLTQAGAAIRIWEGMSGNVERTDKDYFEQFSKFYYGGRTQVFKAGIIDRPFNVYDIVSAYPHAMKDAKHPSGRPFLTENWDNDGAALLTIKAKALGFLPHRNEDGGLSFPDTGEDMTFNCTGWELLNYIELSGEPFDLVECWRYPLLIDFSEYVDRFFKLKKEAKDSGDKAQYIFAKIFLNALYGKFASNPENYGEFMLFQPGEVTPEGWHINELINDKIGFISRPLPSAKHRYYNVGTAASITGFVRAKLARAIYKSKGVIYCDTDSVICEKFAGDEMSGELGGWELEAKCKGGAVAGKKLYVFDLCEPDKKGNLHKTASKGAKLTPQQIKDVAKGETVMYENQAPTFSIKKKPVFIDRNIKRT